MPLFFCCGSQSARNVADADELPQARGSVGSEAPRDPRVPDVRLHTHGAAAAGPPARVLTPAAVLDSAGMTTLRPRRPNPNVAPIDSRQSVGNLVDALARSMRLTAPDDVADMDGRVRQGSLSHQRPWKPGDSAERYLQAFCLATNRAVLVMADSQDFATLYTPTFQPPRRIPLDALDIDEITRTVLPRERVSVIVRYGTGHSEWYACAVRKDWRVPHDAVDAGNADEAGPRAPRRADRLAPRAPPSRAPCSVDVELTDEEADDAPPIEPTRAEIALREEAERGEAIDEMLFTGLKMAAHSFASRSHVHVLASSVGMDPADLQRQQRRWAARHEARKADFRTPQGVLTTGFDYAVFAHEMNRKVVILSNHQDQAVIYFSDFTSIQVHYATLPDVLLDPGTNPGQPSTIIRMRTEERNGEKVRLRELARPVGIGVDQFVESAEFALGEDAARA